MLRILGNDIIFLADNSYEMIGDIEECRHKE